MPIVTLRDEPSAPIGHDYCDFCHQRKDTLSHEPPELLVATVEELETGAGLGCKTCYFRCRTVSTFYTGPGTRVEFSRLQYFTFDNNAYYEIFKMPGKSLSDRNRCKPRNRASRTTVQTHLRGQCKIAGTGDTEFPMITDRSILPGNTSSEQTFWTIESWIQDCLSGHEGCWASSQSSYFPKRVLDVSNDKLVLREGLNETSYACLIYCWGPSQSPIKTLASTIDDFMQDIQWASLSKTFQDAVDICRRLHIDYIWIDSLCIIQDSDEDWATESMKMAQIYENTYLTIAATKSVDGNGGCY